MDRYSQEVNKGEPWAEPDPQGCWVLHSDAEAAIAAAVAAERERCAKVAEGAQHLPNDGKDFANGWCSAALQIAQAIRA